jgi:cytochrome b
MAHLENDSGVLVWPWFVRLSHWLLAALVLFNFFNEELSGQVHRYAGYVAVSTVLLRLLHGLTRPRADFAHIGLPSLRAFFTHIKALRHGHAPRELGHNPAGACMAVLLWALVLALGFTGWMSQWDAFWGEDWLTDLHEWIANTLMACVGLHWLGVVVMSRLQRENLARAMITGRKRP